MIKQWITVIAAMVCFFGTRVGFTASDDNFYKGKTIRLIVAFSAGGGYDAYSRTIGRHLSKYIPGNPAIVVENMTGAGGIIHANFMYQAKPDGLIIGNNAGGLILQQIMGAKGIEFDGKKFEFLGAPGSDHHVCTLSKASGVTSMEKWFAAKEPVKFGGVGPGGGASDNARVLQAALGLPIKVIDGYKGTADTRLAAESRAGVYCENEAGVSTVTAKIFRITLDLSESRAWSNAPAASQSAPFAFPSPPVC